MENKFNDFEISRDIKDVINVTKVVKPATEDYKPLRDVVFEYLRRAILEGRLEPGKRLMEIKLAKQLGVSRTPIREAIRKLELEGLVIMEPRKGAYVADISMKDIVDVLELRSGLESLAAYLAADRMSDSDLKKLKNISRALEECIAKSDVNGILEKDVEFHECIFNSTKNDRLILMMNTLWEQVFRFRVIYASDYEASKNIQSEHREIMDAIASRDREMAAKLAKKHIDVAEKYMCYKIFTDVKNNHPHKYDTKNTNPNKEDIKNSHFHKGSHKEKIGNGNSNDGK